MTHPILSRADVLVIGAGLFGCSVAYHLAGFGRDVLVIDRREIGGEASGANSGNLHLQLSPATHAGDGHDWMARSARQIPFFQAAVALWQDLAKELPGDIELRRTGGLMVAETQHDLQVLRAKVDAERAAGLEGHLLDGTELRDIAPYLGEGFAGAAYCPQEGMANALTAVTAIADECRRRGARFLQQTTAISLLRLAQGWEVETNRGRFVCRDLVIAAGCWSDGIAAQLGVSVPLSHRAIHVSVTEPAEPLISHLCYHTSLRLTLKQVANGNIIIGGGWAAGIEPHGRRPVVLRESLVRSLGVAERVVPAIGSLQLIRTWASRNAYTPDGWPILGPVQGYPNLQLAVCNTYGFTLGPLCGLLVAEAVMGRRASFDMSPFRPERFQSQTRRL